jgi:hypothetical protein
MKKLSSILLIAIASIFCLKDIIVIVASDSGCYFMDLNEEEDESDKTEKSKADEKMDIQEWQLTSSEQLHIVNQTILTTYHNYKEKRYFPPYFEINSPPPELI